MANVKFMDSIFIIMCSTPFHINLMYSQTDAAAKRVLEFSLNDSRKRHLMAPASIALFLSALEEHRISYAP